MDLAEGAPNFLMAHQRCHENLAQKDSAHCPRLLARQAIELALGSELRLGLSSSQRYRRGRTSTKVVSVMGASQAGQRAGDGKTYEVRAPRPVTSSRIRSKRMFARLLHAAQPRMRASARKRLCCETAIRRSFIIMLHTPWSAAYKRVQQVKIPLLWWHETYGSRVLFSRKG